MESTPETRQDRTNGINTRLPACDNCKDRKTKCDRTTPCSSCLTAGLDCRVTRAKPEKRQRIVISAKYDEALESVDSRLQELQDSVNALQQGLNRPASITRAQDTSYPTGSSLKSTYDGQLFGSHVPNRGYQGCSSFEAQAQRGTSAYNPPTTRPFPQDFAHTTGSPHIPNQLLNMPVSTSSGLSLLQTSRATWPPYLESHPELAARPLPPSETVLKLLRLAQAEKQRFFIDVFVLTEHEFTELCRNVYFPISPCTLYSWIAVNVGLLYLFHGLSPHHYGHVGLNASEVRNIVELLTTNAQVSIESLRVCAEPSLEACQVLSLLATFCVKSGQLPRAWSLISTASRTCIDLGLHRLPTSATDRDASSESKVFWFIFVMDKCLALTLGRTQNIPHYDVSTQRPAHVDGLLGIPLKIYAAIFEAVMLQGEMQLQLFSASAQQLPAAVRAQRSTEFRMRLRKIRCGLSKNISDDSKPHTTFHEAAILLDVLLHSLVAVACSAITSDEPKRDSQVSGQQCHTCADCIEASRQALTALVRIGIDFKDADLEGWTMFLNMILSYTPFTSYLVVAVHVMSEHKAKDLDLLASVNSIIEPVAERSETARNVYETCRKLYQAAEQGPRPHSRDDPSRLLAPSHRSSTDHFGSGVLPLQESLSPVSPVSAAAMNMPLGDYQVMLGGLDMDMNWGHV